MNKLILSAGMLVLTTFGYAQVTPTSASAPTEAATTSSFVTVVAPGVGDPASATERNEWLPSFESVVAEGGFDLTFIHTPSTEAPKILYDTKGSYTTKFQAEVRDKVLYIRERIDARRPERTKVTVLYNTLRSLSVSDATVTFDGAVSEAMLDLKIGARASLTAEVNAKDLNVSISGESRATLSGAVRYLTLYISTGRFDGVQLTSMSARVNAQSSAAVVLSVTERLEAQTSTSATIRYKGTPSIIRTSEKLFAGGTKAQE